MSISLLIVAVCFLVLAGVIAIVYAKLRSFARETGADLLLRELKNGNFTSQDLIDDSPKSLSAMTGIELPRIQADFPEFNWGQWKQYCENAIRTYFEALQTENPGLLQGQAAGLMPQAEAAVENLKLQDLRVRYEDVKIHRTEIAGYNKTAGNCRITIQSAAEYFFSQKKQTESFSERRKEQHRLELELVYVQDPEKSEYHTAVGPVCPGCGAPITSLGHKTCPYCGRMVETINSKVWTLMSLTDISVK